MYDIDYKFFIPTTEHKVNTVLKIPQLHFLVC